MGTSTHLGMSGKILSPFTYAHFLSTNEEAKEMDFGVSHAWVEIPLSVACLCNLGQVTYSPYALISSP